MPKKDADQPAYQCSLVSVFVVECQNSILLNSSITKIPRLKLAFVAEQVGLILAEDKFSQDLAHMLWKLKHSLSKIDIFLSLYTPLPPSEEMCFLF